MLFRSELPLSLVKFGIQLVLCTYSGKWDALGGNVLASKTKEEIEFPKYYVYYKDDALYIITKGTDSIEDAIADFTITETTNKYGTFHSGFYNSAMNVYKAVLKYIESHDGKIYFVGHSLGGAVSSVLHVLAKHDYPEKDILTLAYAPAPAMSIDMIDDYKDTLFSFVNEDDIVPLASALNCLALINKYFGYDFKILEKYQDEIVFSFKLQLRLLKRRKIISEEVYDKLYATASEIINILIECSNGTLKRNVRYIAGTVYQMFKDDPKPLEDCEIDPAEKLNILKVSKNSLKFHSPWEYEKRFNEIPE